VVAVPASTGVVAVPASTGVVAVPASTGVVAAAPSTTAAGALCEDSVRELLKQVKDPELFVNIVDLGLIYGVTLTPSTETPGKQQVSVDMTMTSPACPAGPQLIGDTKRTVAAHPEVAGVEVREFTASDLATLQRYTAEATRRIETRRVEPRA
jgi:metal-sulfur cluster biosynthetic enzyme